MTFHLRVTMPATGAAPDDPADQLQRAFLLARRQLNEARAKADPALAPLLDAQELMLDDPDLHAAIARRLAAGRPPALAAREAAAELASLLEGAETAYFRERATDVRAIGTLLAAQMAGTPTPRIPPQAVIVADELSPVDVAQFIDAGVSAFVTQSGGPTSHAAIVARAWGIPAVVGIPDLLQVVGDGVPVLVDGDAGTVTTHFTADAVESAITAPQAAIARRIPVYANAGSLAEIDRAIALDADGIGLLRTELLFQDRQAPPNLEEQAALYRAAIVRLAGRPLTVRTMDIGADKPVPFLSLPVEANPQLGVRGIRLSLQRRDLLATQFRAVLAAAGAGPVQLLLPMVTTVEEVQDARQLLQNLAAETGSPMLPLGVMIEVPMAALAAPELAAVSDFFSLGTNDLLQFLLAADRQQAGTAYLHQAEHPAVWRLLSAVIDAAHAAGIPVSACGEWGADAARLSRLVELGLDAVSVAVGLLPRVRGFFQE